MDPQSAIKISVILYWSALLIYTSYWIVGFMGQGDKILCASGWGSFAHCINYLQGHCYRILSADKQV